MDKEKLSLKDLLKNKKVLIISGSIMLVLVFLIILISLSSNNLNKVERQTYDRLIDFIETGEFFNPKEVRLLDAVVDYEYDDNKREYGDIIEYYYVKISGTNKVSGTINKCYQIYYSDYNNSWTSWAKDCDVLNKTGRSYEKLSRKSIKNINNALTDYWKGLGL